ncbi:MAG: hypothetical protein LKF96_07120 [Treponema sp.]|jgi:hypothetical protein|nr:hypothetical protein [Treponema sp.]
MNNSGSVSYHKNMPSAPECLLHVLSQFDSDNVIGVECVLLLTATNSPLILMIPLLRKSLHLTSFLS